MPGEFDVSGEIEAHFERVSPPERLRGDGLRSVLENMGVSMAKLAEADGGYTHWCPGCGSLHYIAVDQPLPNGARWTFDGDAGSPTFRPSVRHRWGRRLEHCCHYFIEAGRIRYCADSTHGLAGQAVDLPEIPCPS